MVVRPFISSRHGCKRRTNAMNGLIIGAGVIAGMTTAGHFAVGSKQFLAPMLESQFEQVPKKVMHCVFHYVSAFLLFSTLALLLAGFEIDLGGGNTALVRFIGLNYLAFAIWQLAIATASGIPRGIFKLFQWVFFLAIAVLAFAGTLLTN
jgi:hypothetical protein